MLDCIHVYVFHFSKNCFEKLAQHLLDTSSTPYCLSRFFSCFLLLSRQLLDTWWIDRESSCLLDSFSTPGGSIEFLFLDLMSCSSIPQLLTTFSSIPPLIASSIPLDTCIYQALLRVYIFIYSRSDSHFFDLSQSICAYSSPKHHLSHSKPLPL